MSGKPAPRPGYSPKRLEDKLGLKPGVSAAFVGLPVSLEPLVAGPWQARRFTQPKELTDAARDFDFVIAFVPREKDLAADFQILRSAIRRDGMIWICWPKKASRVTTDIGEARIRETGLGLNLVDVKIAAIDEVWSGLKFVIRKDLR